jgi:hypothetical protein
VSRPQPDARLIAAASMAVALFALYRASRRPVDHPAPQPQPSPPGPADDDPAPPPEPKLWSGSWPAAFATLALAAAAAVLAITLVPTGDADTIRGDLILVLAAIGGLPILLGAGMAFASHNRPSYANLDYAGKLLTLGGGALVFWAAALEALRLIPALLWLGYPPVALVGVGLILLGALLVRRAWRGRTT